MKKLLFVCIENSCRSQMAEAFAKMHGNQQIEAYSAGSNPSGKVNPKAIESMQAIGYDLSKHSSKAIDNIPNETYDCLVTMGCGDACPHIPAKNWEDWQIPDPKNLSQDEFNKIRDIIETEVMELIKTLT